MLVYTDLLSGNSSTISNESNVLVLGLPSSSVRVFFCLFGSVIFYGFVCCRLDLEHILGQSIFLLRIHVDRIEISLII